MVMRSGHISQRANAAVLHQWEPLHRSAGGLTAFLWAPTFCSICFTWSSDSAPNRLTVSPALLVFWKAVNGPDQRCASFDSTLLQSLPEHGGTMGRPHGPASSRPRRTEAIFSLYAASLSALYAATSLSASALACFSRSLFAGRTTAKGREK